MARSLSNTDLILGKRMMMRMKFAFSCLDSRSFFASWRARTTLDWRPSDVERDPPLSSCSCDMVKLWILIDSLNCAVGQLELRSGLRIVYLARA